MEPSQFDYKKYLNLVSRRFEMFLILALFIMTAVFAWSYLLPRKYESSCTVYIEKNVMTELMKGLSVTPSMEDTVNSFTYAITSRTLLAKVIDSMDLTLGKSEGQNEALIKTMQRNTSIKMKDKNLFVISYTDSNPRVARDFVNTLVRLYIEENMSLKRVESYDATNFLTGQIENYNAKLEKTAAQVNAYKLQKGGIISIDEGKLFEDIGTAQQKLYDLQLRRRQLEGTRQITRRSNDPLEGKLVSLQKRLGELRVQYTDSFPEVVSVKGDIETVKEQLKSRKGTEEQSVDPLELAKIDSEIGAIKVTEEGLRRYIATNKRTLQSLPSAKAGLEKLEADHKNQQTLYDQLFSRRNQSEVSKQMEVQDKATVFRIVDPAVLPVNPSSPDRLKIMMLGIAGALVASFGLLVLLDQMDHSLKELESVKELGLPVLAIIPKMQQPAVLARQHRRLLRFSFLAALYFLVILCFPAMEILRLPYVDQLLDQVHSTSTPAAVKAPAR
jgi:polysaccharide biosynthesis transport protein